MNIFYYKIAHKFWHYNLFLRCFLKILPLYFTLQTSIFLTSFRQYYAYLTDTQCKRVGTQCWVFG